MFISVITILLIVFTIPAFAMSNGYGGGSAGGGNGSRRPDPAPGTPDPEPVTGTPLVPVALGSYIPQESTDSTGGGSVTRTPPLSGVENPQYADLPPSVDGPRFESEGRGGGMDLPDSLGPQRRPEGMGEESAGEFSNPPMKTKAVVRYNQIFHFRNAMQQILDSSRNAEHYARHNDYLTDGIRVLTLRLWYGYGWASPRWGTTDSPNPMFGYFPVTNESLNVNQIQSDMLEFYKTFNNIAIYGTGYDPLSLNYFDFAPSRPTPLIYISDFGDERTLFDEFQTIACEEAFGSRPGLPADEDSRLATPQPGTFDVDGEVTEAEAAIAGFGIFADGHPEIKIKHWRRSQVRIKKFPHVLLEPRVADTDINFETMLPLIAGVLEQKETFAFNTTAQDCKEGETIEIPKRHYDYVFQFPVVDDQVEIKGKYNGYFSSIYEEAIQSENFFPILEPIIPNLYVIDFAQTSVEEYYKLISLNGNIAGFPGIDTGEYQNLLETFAYSNGSPYMSRWASGIYDGQRNNPNSLRDLASEYKDLLFSNLFSENYKAVSNTLRTGAPMLVESRFNIQFDNGIFNPAFQEAIKNRRVYDPIVNLASDTELVRETVPNNQPFACPHINSPIPSEFIRREFVHTSADTTPYVMEKSTDFSYEVSNVWNMHEWFNLYCVPEDTALEADMACFHREFPEQRAMLAQEPETWLLDSEATKPIPVGAKEVDTNNSSSPVGRVLVTPDGEKWNRCTGVGTVIDSLSGLYKNIDDIIEKVGFRSYQEVVDGKVAYSEPLFYRLERNRKPSLRTTFKPGIGKVGRDMPQNIIDRYAVDIDQNLQNFFLPANLLEGGFTYADAQIHYGQEYDYDLYGYYFVLGNEYWYEKTEDTPQESAQRSPLTWSQLTQEEIRDFTEDFPVGYFGLSTIATQNILTIEGLLLYNLEQDTLSDLSSAAGIRPSALDAFAQVAKNKMVALYQRRLSAEGAAETDRVEEILNDIIEEQVIGASALDTDDPPIYIYGGPAEPEEGETAEQYYARVRAEAPRITTDTLFRYVTEQRNNMLAEVTAARAAVMRTGTGATGREYSFSVHNRPHLVLVETRVFSPDIPSMTTKALDKPPVPPDIDIIPYRSVKNKALHMLNGNVGNYTDKAIIIEPGDVQKFKAIIEDQEPGRPVTDGNVEEFDINFSTDDYPETFEIFRLDFAPTSYRDFNQGRKIVLNNTAKTQPYRDTTSRESWRDQVVVTSNSIVDDVEPNKRYWYTFRVTDIHENMSNPTGVLQFEMVDTGNSIFPIIEEYQFPTPDINYMKPMRRYLKISPSSLQTAVSEQISSAGEFRDEHPNLGELASQQGGSVWNKNYKIRLTSKLTGKKMDINFSFKQSRVDDDRLITGERITEESTGYVDFLTSGGPQVTAGAGTVPTPTPRDVSSTPARDRAPRAEGANIRYSGANGSPRRMPGGVPDDSY